MRTVYAWLIANVESVTTLLVVAAFLSFLFTDPSITMETGDRVGLALLGALVVSLGKTLLGGIPSRNVLTDVVNLLIIVAVYAVLFVFGIAGLGHHEPFFSSVFWDTLSVCIVSLLIRHLHLPQHERGSVAPYALSQQQRQPVRNHVDVHFQPVCGSP